MKGPTSPPEISTALEEWVLVNMGNLQRSLYRTRMALAIITVGLVVAIVGPRALRVGQDWGILPVGPDAGEVRAQRFVLTDGDDHIRGTWGVDESGMTRLQLRDHAGVARLRISVLDNGSPGMAFTDEGGRSRVVLGLLPDRSSSLVFADPTGATRAVLGISADEGATLVFADRSGETRAGLGVDKIGQPTFLMTEDPADSEADAGGGR